MPRHTLKRAASGLTYGLLLGLVSVLALSAIAGAGGSVNRLFGTVSDRLSGVRRAVVQPTPTPGPTALPANLYVDFIAGNDANPGTSLAAPKLTLAAALTAVSSGGTVGIIPRRYDLSYTVDGNTYETFVINNVASKTVTIEGNDALFVMTLNGTSCYGVFGVGGSTNTNVTLQNFNAVVDGPGCWGLTELGYGNANGIATAYHSSTGTFVFRDVNLWLQNAPGYWIYRNGSGSTTVQTVTAHVGNGGSMGNTFLNHGSGSLSGAVQYPAGNPSYLTRAQFITAMGY